MFILKSTTNNNYKRLLNKKGIFSFDGETASFRIDRYYVANAQRQFKKN